MFFSNNYSLRSRSKKDIKTPKIKNKHYNWKKKIKGEMRDRVTERGADNKIERKEREKTGG